MKPDRFLRRDREYRKIAQIASGVIFSETGKEPIFGNSRFGFAWRNGECVHTLFVSGVSGCDVDGIIRIHVDHYSLLMSARKLKKLGLSPDVAGQSSFVAPTMSHQKSELTLVDSQVVDVLWWLAEGAINRRSLDGIPVDVSEPHGSQITPSWNYAWSCVAQQIARF